MAHLVEQFSLEALSKIMRFLGVEYFRCWKGRLTLAKRYSDDLSAFFCLQSRDRITAAKYRCLVEAFHGQDELLPDAPNHVITCCIRGMAQYRGVFGTICTCRAWFRGVEKYLGVFDSSLHELCELVSWDCKVPCMNHVQANLADGPEASLFLDACAAISRHSLYLDSPSICVGLDVRCSAVAGDLLKKLRRSYHALLDNVSQFHECDEPDFGISLFESSLRRRRLRARLWRGSGLYRR